MRTDASHIRLTLMASSSSLIAKAIEIALNGDAAMLRWCCDHLLGRPSSEAELAFLLERTLLVKAQRAEIERGLKPQAAAVAGVTRVPMRGQLSEEERAQAANELEPR
jgi:hypothetical protein